MYYEDAIQLITDYYKSFSVCPNSLWPDKAIREYSYAEWMIFELISDISDNPFEDAIDVVFSRLMEIEYMEHQVGSAKSRLLFKISIKTCNEILYLMKRRQNII